MLTSTATIVSDYLYTVLDSGRRIKIPLQQRSWPQAHMQIYENLVFSLAYNTNVLRYPAARTASKFREFMSPAIFCLIYMNYHGLKFTEQKTETKNKNFIQSISIFSGHDISTYRCFIKNCIKLWEHLHSKVLHIYRH